MPARCWPSRARSRCWGIDETRRGRAVWRLGPDGASWVRLERFETNFVDLSGPQGLLGQAAGRTRANVVAWLDERGQEWKDRVEIVAMTRARRIGPRCAWRYPMPSSSLTIST